MTTKKDMEMQEQPFEDNDEIEKDEEDGEGDDMDSNEDSSSDDEVEVTASKESLEEMMQLEKVLRDSPYDYDSHIKYISAVRHCGLRERLRTARHTMAETFPLKESLWKEWIYDEMQQAKSGEDLSLIETIFEKACSDYLSVSIWLDRLRFLEASGKDAATLRQHYENALTSAGLHVSQGHQIWSAFREFETKLVEQEHSEKGRAAQMERVRGLFQRQLAVPHSDHAHTLEAYTSWDASQSASPPSADVLKAYSAAVLKLEARLQHEAVVAEGKEPDATLLAAYINYISYEQSHGNPAQVQCIFERAVATFPVTHELWRQYTHYLEGKLRIAAVTRSAYARAVRNCHWVGSLWEAYMRFEESQQALPQ
ncbi:hypothetical protein CYMTET_23386, partial [Cymbomonas tetramitiformis]